MAERWQSILLGRFQIPCGGWMSFLAKGFVFMHALVYACIPRNSSEQPQRFSAIWTLFET